VGAGAVRSGRSRLAAPAADPLGVSRCWSHLFAAVDPRNFARDGVPDFIR
jgi:hypothetical protein